MELPSNQYSLVYSRDFRNLAISVGKAGSEQEWVGTTTLWDLTAGRPLSSFKFDYSIPPNEFPGYYSAFSEDGRTFLLFVRGKVRFIEIVTGEIAKGLVPLEFPHGEKQHSHLVTDARGHHYVLTNDRNDSTIIRDLLNGQHVGSVPNKALVQRFVPGAIYFYDQFTTFELRELPTGKHRVTLDGMTVGANWTVTPDCNTLASCGWINANNTRVLEVMDLTNGGRRVLPGFVNIHAISPDGRFLALEQSRDIHPWFAWLLGWIGQRPTYERNLVIYDLTMGWKAASFGNARFSNAVFSLDGQSLAILSGNNLQIFDVPLQRPWDQIVGYSLVTVFLTASILWLFGWLYQYRETILKKLPSFLRQRILAQPISKDNGH
jgi:hypothetical protein